VSCCVDESGWKTQSELMEYVLEMGDIAAMSVVPYCCPVVAVADDISSTNWY